MNKLSFCTMCPDSGFPCHYIGWRCEWVNNAPKTNGIRRAGMFLMIREQHVRVEKWRKEAEEGNGLVPKDPLKLKFQHMHNRALARRCVVSSQFGREE